MNKLPEEIAEYQASVEKRQKKHLLKKRQKIKNKIYFFGAKEVLQLEE